MERLKIEKHPFEAFVPDRMTCLIIGSFPGKEQTQCTVGPHHWFYGAPRNQFWKILELVYNRPLPTRYEKQQLFEEAGIGVADLIQSCVRTNGTNLDENLQVKTYNDAAIRKILDSFHPKVLFTSRFVERTFRKLFPQYSNTDILPSPSPRYFRLSIKDKAAVFKEKLPALKQ